MINFHNHPIKGFRITNFPKFSNTTRAEHRAQSTEHRAQSTEHRAQSTVHSA